MVACGSGGNGADGAGGTGGAAGGDAGSGGSAGGSGGSAGGPSELQPGPGQYDPDFATSPDFFTNMSQRSLGRTDISPHMMVRMYYSTNIQSVIGEDAFDALPRGTVAIKEQDRDADPEVDQVMVMIKQSAMIGDWVFEQRDPTTGELVTSSETDSSFGDFCMNCHQMFPDTDGLAGGKVTN